MAKKNIPYYVVNWTYSYFHQSEWDVPVGYPGQRTIKFLSQFKKPNKITLFRGLNRYNKSNRNITSWTYDLNVAKRYAEEFEGKVVKKEFLSEKVLLDTTLLEADKKLELGYDYKVDDKEVLIWPGKL